MIKNTHYSYEYHQPKEYRFSLDSVFLAQKVAKSLKYHPRLEELALLDVCAGCGVVGLEVQFHLPEVAKIDFVEVQEIYRPYFEKNAQQAQNNRTEFNFLALNYAELLNAKFEEKYDVVVSNPPYFFIGEGLLSPNDFKNRCRFFIDSDFRNLIESILFVLKKSGKAYLLVRPGIHHGRDLFQEIKKITENRATALIFDEVRGTNIVELTKKP